MIKVDSEVISGNGSPSRTLAFVSATVLIPVTWMFLLHLSFQLIFTGTQEELGILFGLMAVLTLFTAEFSRRLANRLLWLNRGRAAKKVAAKKAVPVKPAGNELTRERLKQILPYCEKRATGNRVIVEAHAFQFGAARKHLEVAPWYRN